MDLLSVGITLYSLQVVTSGISIWALAQSGSHPESEE